MSEDPQYVALYDILVEIRDLLKGPIETIQSPISLMAYKKIKAEQKKLLEEQIRKKELSEAEDNE